MSSDSPTDRELLLEILWRLRRIEEALANVRTERRTSSQSSEPPSVVYGPRARPQPRKPQGPMPVKAEPDPPEESSKRED
jgi:hypothetical protein